MAERSQVLPLRCDWQRALHAKDQVLALQGMQEAVQRHGRHADARTHLPLLTWAQAIYLTVSSSKGISAVKLSEMLDVHYVTAWHLGHRIRAMMAERHPVLSGVVEIDEMYAGAPPRKRARSSRDDDGNPPNPTGRGTKRPLVLVAAERGGDAVAKVIPTHGKAAIAAALDGVVEANATCNDGWPPGLQTHRQDAAAPRGEPLGPGVCAHGSRDRTARPCQSRRELQRLHAPGGDRRVPRDLGQTPRALYW